MADETEPKEKNVGGRPTRCSLELAEKIGALVVDGASIVAACQVVGIGTDLLSDWKKRPDEPYKGFTSTLRAYFAAAVADAEIKVYKGAKGWQASARWLESMQRDRWCRTERREVDLKTSTSIHISFPDRPGHEAAKETARQVGDMLSEPDDSGKS